MFVRRTRAGLGLWQVERWTSWDVLHAFSDRYGGVSRPPFASLNVGLHVGDDAAAVQENRRRLCRALGIDQEALVAARQVHGATVAVVDGDDRGRGAFALSDAVPGADALVTDAPGVVLLALFADCVPVFLFDPVRRTVGLAHAGWKGTAGGIARRAVQTLHDAFGSSPSDCHAAVGPAIGPCCYEVGEDVAGVFGDAGADIVTRHGPRFRLDLWEANRRQLEAAGVPRENITVARLCTRCMRDTFFSHRGDGGRTGRMAAVIGL